MPDILSSVARHFVSARCPPKKMSSQYQLPCQGILLDFALTGHAGLLPNFTEVGHHVQRVSKHLPDLPDMSDIIRISSNCLFIFKNWWICLSIPVKRMRTFMKFCDKRSELISRKMTNDGEWWWNSAKCKIWFTRNLYILYMMSRRIKYLF